MKTSIIKRFFGLFKRNTYIGLYQRVEKPKGDVMERTNKMIRDAWEEVYPQKRRSIKWKRSK